MSCNLTGKCLSFRYLVPFSASIAEVSSTSAIAKMALKGTAIDDTVNQNNWQVPNEELKWIVDSLKGAQLRVDHSESIRDVIGKVGNAFQEDNKVQFDAESGDEVINNKINKGYLNSVSIQVDSDKVECSGCGAQTRFKNALVHAMHDNAWEKVREPKTRELSIVATPAYSNTKFGMGSNVGGTMVYQGFKSSMDSVISNKSAELINDLNAYTIIRSELMRRGVSL